jgi:hypothetical protein
MVLVIVAAVVGIAYLVEMRRAEKRHRELCSRRLEVLVKGVGDAAA